MEELWSSQGMFYALHKDFPFALQFRLTFDFPLDRAALTKALAVTIARYPYLKVKMKRQAEEICLADNEKPFLLYEDVAAPTLDPVQNNDYLLRVSAAGNRLTLCICHALVDGRGFVPFLKTLLHYYWAERFGRDSGIPAVRLLGDSLNDEESRDPYLAFRGQVQEPLPPASHVPEVFQLSRTMDAAGRKYVSCFRMDADEFMNYVHRVGGTPNALAAQLLSEVIAEVHPERQADISVGVAMDLRPALGVSCSHHCSVSLISLSYEKGQQQLPGQRTAWYRREIKQGSSLEAQRTHAAYSQVFIHRLKSLPTMQEKMNVSRTAVEQGMARSTFTVSYIGQEDLGEINEHLCFMEIVSDSAIPTLTVIISSCGKWFFFVLNQNFADDRYVRGLLHRFEAIGISCIDVQQQIVPPVPFMDLEEVPE